MAFSPRHHDIDFDDGVAKASWLDHAAGRDALKASVSDLARQIGSECETDYAVIERVTELVRDELAYVRDPGHREQFADSATILRRAFDDCDGKSRLAVALLRAVHRLFPEEHDALEGRIRAVFEDDEFIHVQAWGRGAGTDDYPLSVEGGWILIESTLEGVELGQGVEGAKVDASGKVVTT